MLRRKLDELPEDFEAMLGSASLDELKAVFKRCALDARGGPNKRTAIGFVDCPDALVEWLVGRGLAVDASDRYDASALWERASAGHARQIPLLLSLGADIEKPRRYVGSPLHGATVAHKVEVVSVLLEHGASVNALNDKELTPLEHVLQRTQNMSIGATAQVAEVLLDAGAQVTPGMREEVERIGKGFEFHRANFNPEFLDEVQAGLSRLYRLFDVTPVAARAEHERTAPIVVPPGVWQEQHPALWDLLVPSQGAAPTAQGEVIRLTGKLAHEILDNGGLNWDKNFRAMLDAVPALLASGTPLPTDVLQEAGALARQLRSGEGDRDPVYRLSELAVSWVAANPTPIPLELPPYAR